MAGDVPAAPPPLVPFDEACALVVTHLKKTVPMAMWSVSRRDGPDHVHLCVQDEAYGLVDGDRTPWSESLCQYMLSGAPHVAPDAMRVPAYAGAGAAQALSIGAYVGFPILDADGSLFGTLCGFDPSPQPAELVTQEPVLHLLATLLEQILMVERWRDEAVARREELHWRAFHDHLTELPNRAMFLDRLGRALARPPSDGQPTGLLVLDLDDFKAINDRFGHAAGDDLLREVTRRLQGVLHPSDVLARLAGDEFAVLVQSGTAAPVVAARMRAALRRPVVVDGTAVTITASIGVSDLEDGPPAAQPAGRRGIDLVHGTRVDAVLARADVAMYTAKHAGKDRVAHHDAGMTLPGVRDLALREPLRRALYDRTITVAYQPIVSLPTGRTVGYEALARWTHEGVVIDPDVFVPMAARAGLMPELTDHVLDVAMAQMARWTAQNGHGLMAVGVNVSPRCISDPSLPDRIDACLRRHGVNPVHLVLEITEDALLGDLDTAVAVAHRLQDRGVVLSLDDFGTGYSSLLHLHQIPLAALKIDRGFAAGLDTNPATARFMGALLALGRDLGLRVVVEGVERAEQAEVLRGLGCEYAQGHLFGRPAPP